MRRAVCTALPGNSHALTVLFAPKPVADYLTLALSHPSRPNTGKTLCGFMRRLNRKRMSCKIELNVVTDSHSIDRRVNSVPDGVAAGCGLTPREEIDQRLRRPSRPWDRAVLLWYKLCEYPYWPCVVIQDRSKFTLVLIDLERDGVTVTIDCLKEHGKDFMGDGHEDLVAAGYSSGFTTFDTAIKKATYLTTDRYINTVLSTFLIDCGYFTHSAATDELSQGLASLFNQLKPFDSCVAPGHDYCTSAIKHFRVRKHALMESIESDSSNDDGSDETNRNRSPSKGRRSAAALYYHAEESRTQVGEQSDAADSHLAGAAAGHHIVDQPGKRETEVAPNRIVVKAEVHAPFDGEPCKKDGPARPLSNFDEASRSACVELLQRLATANDLNDDLIVLDDDSPVEFCTGMVVWYKHRKEPFWPALIESSTEGRFTVRFLNGGPVHRSCFTIRKAGAYAVMHAYPGANYLKLTGYLKKIRDPSAFMNAVKQANKLVRERQRSVQ